MSFRVILTLPRGEKTERTAVDYDATPRVGDVITVIYDFGSATVQVTAVHKHSNMDVVEAMCKKAPIDGPGLDSCSSLIQFGNG